MKEVRHRFSCCHGSSSNTERIFSYLSLLLTLKRNRLTLETISKLLMVQLFHKKTTKTEEHIVFTLDTCLDWLSFLAWFFRLSSFTWLPSSTWLTLITWIYTKFYDKRIEMHNKTSFHGTKWSNVYLFIYKKNKYIYTMFAYSLILFGFSSLSQSTKLSRFISIDLSSIYLNI